MNTKESIIESLLLGKKDKKLLTVIYMLLLLVFFLYFIGKICGEAIFYLLN
ncbi:hypothetical protein ABXT06_06495 [Flavobacterium sp. UW10123]|uniref:hypothetical protein n=1 Tax=Flavobacterium sp. UW10123 TaxID=3230800 RepID=UPI003392C81A